MSLKSINFKIPEKPKTAEEWVGQGLDPHVKEIVAVAKAEQPEAVMMKRFTIDVPATLHMRIKLACTAKGHVMADIIREILEREFPAAKS